MGLARTADQWAQIILKMMPKGRAWTRGISSFLFNLLLGMSAEFARIDQSIASMFDEMDPRTTSDLISDWEKFVSLPDSTQAIAAQLSDRRADVVRKLTDPGGQSSATFQALAAGFGYSITTQTFTPNRAGFRCGSPCFGVDWAWHWAVHAPVVVAVPLYCGFSAGAALGTWRNTVLEAVVRNAAQTQSTPVFYYGS